MTSGICWSLALQAQGQRDSVGSLVQPVIMRLAMNLQELNSHAVAGSIDELNLISIEGGIYLLEARMHGAA